MSVVIGTRGSALALAQAQIVASRLGADAEIRVIRTAGDENERPIRQLGDGAFVRALEDALLRRDVDLAVHSLKDLPAEERAGIVLAAVPAREDPRDVLVTSSRRGLASLHAHAIVGTSSPRREAFIRALRPDVVTSEIRGNVDTRLRKVSDGEYDATIVALAGLRRLSLAVDEGEILDERAMPPAAGQGALAVQCRARDDAVRARVAALDDPALRRAVETERALLLALGASCALRLGALARADDAVVHLAAALPVGDEIARFDGAGNDPAALAAAAARSLGEAFLYGVTVVLTREEDDDRALADELRVLRSRVVIAPCVRVVPAADRGQLALALATLSAEDLLVVTSRAGADAVASSGIPLKTPVAAVGRATADRLRSLGVRASSVSRTPSAAGLATELPLPRGAVVLARSDRATSDLPEALRRRGAHVREVVAYRTVIDSRGDLTSAREALARDPSRTAVVFASPSAVEGCVRAMGAPALAKARCVAIGTTTASAIRDLVGATATIARTPDDLGLIAAIVAVMRREAAPVGSH